MVAAVSGAVGLWKVTELWTSARPWRLRRVRHAQQTGEFFLRSQPAVAMMESSDHRELDDRPVVGRFHLPRFRGVFLQRQMRSATVIIRKITAVQERANSSLTSSELAS